MKTINFDLYIIEIPAENISVLDDVWRALYTQPFRFNSYDAFCANSFVVGFGQVPMWDEIGDLLRPAGGKKVEKISVLLPDGQANDITIAVLYDEQDIFYTSTDGSLEGATLGPGRLALRIKAEKIPGARGVCKVSAQPVFPSLVKSPISKFAGRTRTGDFLFTPAGFRLKMSPNDFIFLGPEKYIEHQITLGSLFFSRAKRKPVVRTYLLVCTSIIY